jgi:hypothetical protein
VENRTTQESKNFKCRNKKKTRGNEGRLLANFFPKSKPFWEDNSHKLECFTCKFSQNMKKNCDEPIKQMQWITKRIRKDGKTHIIDFCPTRTSGDPWISHGEREYTMIQIDMENQKETAMQQKKAKTKEGWLKRP